MTSNIGMFADDTTIYSASGQRNG